MLRHEISNEILDKPYNDLKVKDEDEGNTYININILSKTLLGKQLSPLYSHMFVTFLGKTSSVNEFLNAVTKPNYPMRYLKYSRLHKDQIDDIKELKEIDVPNKYALLAYALCSMVMQNKHLQTILKENKLKLVYKTHRNKSNIYYNRYLSICMHIQYMIKNNIFDRKHIKCFINKCKEDITKSYVDGIACNITSPERLL